MLRTTAFDTTNMKEHDDESCSKETPETEKCMYLGALGSTQLVLIIETPDQYVGQYVARAAACRRRLSSSGIVVVVLCWVIGVDYCNAVVLAVWRQVGRRVHHKFVAVVGVGVRPESTAHRQAVDLAVNATAAALANCDLDHVVILHTNVHREAEKRNQFSFVCIFLMLHRNWWFFSHTLMKV